MVTLTYFLACQVLEYAGFKGKLRAVPGDNEGIDALIISDYAYDCLQWTRSPTLAHEPREACLPRMVDIDRHLDRGSEREGSYNAVSNGSFSKLLSPGGKAGWV